MTEANRSSAMRLERVHSSGRWIVWAALVLAILWLVCVAVAIVTSMDLDVLLGQPPIALLAGAVMAFMPGCLILMAGFMAREGARGAAANALVLEAAGKLLAPAGETAGQAESLASRLASSARDVDEAMGQALGSMKALSTEIGDERLRLESVSYAAADNARDLATQLGQERTALESLIRDLRAQGETLNADIPRQAHQIVQAARQAADEIGRADEVLEARLEAMRQASQTLSSELSRLNQMAGEAGAHSESLMHAIARVEDKLDQSKRTVDMAVRASETAVAAASSTGEALQTAVSSALDDARRASLEIQKRTRESSEDAAMQIQVLRQSAEQAAAALKAVGIAARAESDLTEKRLSQASDALRRAVSPAPAAPSAVKSTPPQRPPLTPRVPPASPDPRPHQAEPDALFASPPRSVPEAPARSIDTELFDDTPPVSPPLNGAASERRDIPVFSPSFEPANLHLSNASAPAIEPRRETPPPFDPVEDFDDEEPEPGFNANDAMGPSLEGPRREMGWSSILNDMDREDTRDLSREGTAELVIRRLEGAGMTLANIFRPKDKRKIAMAARKGEGQRRSAIRSTAKFELDRVNSRLMKDKDFVAVAREFVTLETADAMAALDRTQKSSRNASPRLSAFLLLDAALEN